MQTIYARKTAVREISNDEADDFIKKYHRQGLPKFTGCRYNVGLFYNGELVGEVSFSNPRTKAKIRKYQHELVRMTFKSDVRVIGGASKLIKFYIADYKPRNFFTYQTTSGQNSDVYEHAGMTLRNRARDKEILVKNGYTYDEAVQEHKELGTKHLFLNSLLVNLGPDHVLKTHIGEKFDDNGNRKTNAELFIEYCGYHKESVAGDNVYDYNNPKYTHYVYKITNTDPSDDHYYIGRHSDYSENGLTRDDLIHDGYLGSGGLEYQTWKQATYDNGFKLNKEILKVEHNWTKNVRDEKRLIGDLYKIDPLCLNKVAGGETANLTQLKRFVEYSHGKCEKHGNVLLRNGKCVHCLGEQAIHNDDYCKIHGNTTFNGRRCIKCQTSDLISTGFCEKHGKTTYFNGSCMICNFDKRVTSDVCKIHGETVFLDGRCLRCAMTKTGKITMKNCPIHGVTAFRGDSCMKCWINNVRTVKYCPIHGYVTFNGNSCMNCVNSNTIYTDVCKIHGKTKFKGGRCCKCISESIIHMGICKKHGKTKFAGKQCLKCKNQKAITRKWCDKCQKITGWNGNRCMSCVNRSMYSIKVCPVHGETKFRGKSCMKCSAEKAKVTRLRHQKEKLVAKNNK